MFQTARPNPLAQRDPIAWCVVIALAFAALAWHRLALPSVIYFDEVHYVPAARKMLALESANPEHPLLGKQIIAAAIALLGDRPLAWRVPAWLFGTLGLFAIGRALWWSSQRRFATLAGMVLVATDFAWFIQSRIAMLDMFMASFVMLALWQLAAAVRRPERPRWRLALAGVFLGLALGTKWSALAPAALPGLGFLAWKLKDTGWRFMWARAGGAVPGISLIEAAMLLGLLPLVVYWLTYMPAFFYAAQAVDPLDPIKHHQWMVQLQDSVTKPHPYSTRWYHWIGNWRGVWYLYQEVDGAQRGIVLIGNPFTMLAGLPAAVWALWAGLRQRRFDALAAGLLFAVSIGMWIGNGKPIQFYYHYLLPGTFLMACLALALDAFWTAGQRWLAGGAVLLSVALFGWFYPIISAAKLCCGRSSFEFWMWLASWR